MFSLPGYESTEELYENNLVKVYRGQRIQDQLPVMIKALQEGANPVDMSKLVNEYEITRTLDIQGIIKPVRLERAGSIIALIMEDKGAIPLRKYLQVSPPNLSLFFSMAIQLTKTLGELHYKGVIHRDLRTDNLLIHPSTGQVSIILTAALMSRKNQNELIPNTLAGIPAYMSPEQIGGRDWTIDQRSDFYSLGWSFMKF